MMDNKAWERWQRDYDESLGATTPAVSYEEDKSYDSHSFLEVGKVTAKAYFFITEDNAFHTHGFWAPKALVSKIDHDTKEVFIEDWFKKNIVDFFK